MQAEPLLQRLGRGRTARQLAEQAELHGAEQRLGAPEAKAELHDAVRRDRRGTITGDTGHSPFFRPVELVARRLARSCRSGEVERAAGPPTKRRKLQRRGRIRRVYATTASGSFGSVGFVPALWSKCTKCLS